MTTPSLPYEILIRSKDGALRGIAAYDAPQSQPRALTKEELAALVPGIDTAALARIAELEAEIATLKADPKAPPAQPTGSISKLTLMHRLNALGKWPAFKALLTHLPEIVQDAWHLAQSISPTDPLFIDAAPAIKAHLDLTDEQFASLLSPSE